MDIKRAMTTGAILWVLIFFEVSILMFGFKLDSKIDTLMYYSIHYILVLVFVILVSLFYFSKNTRKKVKPSAKEGLILGLIMLVIGTILDSIITIPLFMNFDYTFFLSPYLIVSYIGGVIITTIVGVVKK